MRIYTYANKKGFTLIELLVVISIIGVLIGLSIFGIQGARKSSRDSKRKADLELIRSGLEIYKADCNIYPNALSWGGSLSGSNPSGVCSSDSLYISQIPQDPTSAVSTYYYTTSGTNAYYLCAKLEQAPVPAANAADLAHCATCTSSCNYVVKNP